MWAELPGCKPKPSKKGTQLCVICLSCGASGIIYSIPNWAIWGCESCMAPPTGGLSGQMKYITPHWGLQGWDHAIPIEALIAADRIHQCHCNLCKGSMFVGEAA